jgi:hypothetical protein
MSNWSFRACPAPILRIACCALATTSVYCGGSRSLHGNGSAVAGRNGAGGANGDVAGSSGGVGIGGDGGTAGGGVVGLGGAGAADSGADSAAATPEPDGAAGTTGAGGTVASGWKNYEVSGSFPTAPIAIAQKSGQLKFTKIVIQDQFLAESCAIGDYNGDGIPDVSSGRIWYEGSTDPMTTFKTQHPFRDGHGVLPATGAPIELNTGVSDDSADYPWDMDGDGDTDIIDVAQPDMPESNSSTNFQTGVGQFAAGTPNKIGIVQVHATAYWYENPGKAGQAGDPKWTAHLMNADVRAEQHVLVDMNGDGYPEIVGACRNCATPASPGGDTKGYYQGDPTNPTAAWIYHQVTGHFMFPFGNLGRLHGLGAGDINGDGLPDFLDRTGAYLQQPGGTWNLTICTGKNTPAGCGWIQAGSPLLPMGFSEVGLKDTIGNVGPSHMYSVDMDKDGCSDVVAAEWAHGKNLYWYQQQKDATGCTFAFKRYQFMGDAAPTAHYQPVANSYQASNPGDAALWGAGFTEPHALQVFDMDGDGRPDVITGKMRFAQPYDQGDPDPDGTPYLYVFRNVAVPDSRNGAPITLEPILVDGDPTATEGTTDAGMGVGQQIAIGHVNTDGIMDICIASKVGLAVFLGQ